MNPWLVLCAAGCVSWLLRVTFIDIFPARNLPSWIRTALDASGPAAITALIASELSHTTSPGGSFPAALVATAAAVAITLRFQNLGLTAGTGIGAYWLALSVIAWL